MKIRLLPYMLVSAALLSACGGSDHESSDTSKDSIPTISFQQWTSFYLDFTEDDDFDIYSTLVTIDQGKYYSKILSPLQDQFPVIVTQTGLYDTGPEHPTYGPLRGQIEISGNSWKRKLYSSLGDQGLIWTQSFKYHDISGKNLSEILIPYYHLQFKYTPEEMSDFSQSQVKYLQGFKFPQGSRCLIWISEDVSEDYIEIEPYDDGMTLTYQQEWNTLANQTNPVANKYIFKNTIAYFEPEYYDGYAQYLNRYHAVSFYPKGLDEFYNHEADRQEIINDTSLSEQERQYELERLQLYSNQCDLYNPIALKAIQSALK